MQKNSMHSKQVILILTHKITDSIVELYNDLKIVSNNQTDLFLLFHQKEKVLQTVLTQLTLYTFHENVLYDLGYIPLKNSIVPGSTYFPVLKFFRDYPEYTYYWVIEYDVRFSGGWKYFFKNFNQLKAGLITCHIKHFREEPDWPWWEIKHPNKHVDSNQKLRSFNPIYRISKDALVFMHQILTDKWVGHYEVMLPTFLNLGGFELIDMGGVGEFVPIGYENKHYTSSNNHRGVLFNGTLRYIPVFKSIGFDKNKIYHPVK